MATGKKASKAAKRAVPNVSSGTSLPPTSAAKKVAPSSVLHAAFAPSSFQLSLFASVIQSLDADRLRIHDTVSGALRCEYTPQRIKITCLDWGCYGPRHDDGGKSRKKRRKLEQQMNGDATSHGGDDMVVALGTDRAEVELYSPAEVKVIATLRDGHAQGIVNIRFQNHGQSSRAWSLGGDERLVEWDVMQRSILRCVSRPLRS